MRFMLFQFYGGIESDTPSMDEWTPAEVEAHIAFQQALNAELEAAGEFVDGQALAAPEQAHFVLADGVSAPVVTDGPYPESKELVAGFRTIDVESTERALEIAALASAAPGPIGPIKMWIEVRQVLGPVGTGD